MLIKKRIRNLLKLLIPAKLKANLVWKPARNLGKLAPYVFQMAKSGQGTDECLELGCLPMRVNYYSPVPDIEDLFDRKVFEQRSSLAGVNFYPERQVQFLLELGRKFGDECDWPLRATSDPTQFFLNNGSFSFGCAAALHTMIRHWRPRRILEIGSGNSSLVISAALKKNRDEEPSSSCDYTIIDPYPRDVISSGKLGQTSLHAERVELSDLAHFEALEANDILFIDSGHVVKIGADVNFLILEVLPRLKPGVLVHFHDINLPYAPPTAYYTNPKFRMFWTEEFLLQAFLCGNRNFEVLLAMNFIQTDHMDAFCKAFPHFDRDTNWANSGSFWIRSVAKS